MGLIFEGRFIYSLADCHCRYCLYVTKRGTCRLKRCCCLEEKLEAEQYSPPYGFERREGRHAVDQRRAACRSA